MTHHQAPASSLVHRWFLLQSGRTRFPRKNSTASECKKGGILHPPFSKPGSAPSQSWSRQRILPAISPHDWAKLTLWTWGC